MAASLTPAASPNETLDVAYELGHLGTGMEVEDYGSIGNGPAGGADVEWYTFTLDQPALIASKLERQPNDSSFEGVLSLFNNDPYDFYDPYDADGYRLLDQVDQPANGGDATLEQLLGPGTYYLAVSGAGNDYFNPLLADSGIPGTTGDFDLLLKVDDSGLGSATGPQVLTTDPAPSAVLSSSPLAIRIDMSGPLDPSTLIPGQTVQLIFSPNGTFGPDDQQIPLASVNFSLAVEDPPPSGQDAGTVQHYQGINELQLFPESPLAPGYYEVLLAGKSVGGSVVVADLNGNDLNADAGHPDGQDFTDTFQVDGIDGRTGADASSDGTPATAQNLGDLTSSSSCRSRARSVMTHSTAPPIHPVTKWTCISSPSPGRAIMHSWPRSSPAASARRSTRASASSSSIPPMAASSSSRATTIPTIPSWRPMGFRGRCTPTPRCSPA